LVNIVLLIKLEGRKNNKESNQKSIMNLEKITEQLQQVTDLLNEKIPAYTKTERVYLERFYDLYLHSPRGTDKARESEAKAILMEEGIYEAYANLKVDLKVLTNRKELLLEMLKNERLTMQLAK
jgi:hypothetical protein